MPRRGTEVSYRTWHTLQTLFVGRIRRPSIARTFCGGVSQLVLSTRGSRLDGRSASRESSPRGCGHLLVNDTGILLERRGYKFALEAKLWIVEGAEAPTLVNPGFACRCGANAWQSSGKAMTKA